MIYAEKKDYCFFYRITINKNWRCVCVKPECVNRSSEGWPMLSQQPGRQLMKKQTLSGKGNLSKKPFKNSQQIRQGDNTLEQRIFLALLLIGMLITLISGLANIYLRSPLQRIMPPLFILMVLAVLFWYSVQYGRFKGSILLASFFTCLGVVPYIWTAHGGLFGGFPFFIPFLAVVLMALHQGLLRWLFLALLSASTLWMITLDLSESTQIIAITDAKLLNYSNLYGLIGSTIGVIVLFMVFTHTYVAERKRVTKMAEALKKANVELEYLSRYDVLTNLPNRRDITEKMKYQLKLANRSQRSFGIILLDVDHFKKFNDKYGHQCGDYVLQALAELLLKIKREQDTAARWGGEEFILLLPDTDMRGTLIMAEKIRIMVEQHDFNDGVTDHRLTITVGAAAYDHKSLELDDYIRKADTALYWGKEQGRNRSYGYTYKMLTLESFE